MRLFVETRGSGQRDVVETMWRADVTDPQGVPLGRVWTSKLLHTVGLDIDVESYGVVDIDSIIERWAETNTADVPCDTCSEQIMSSAQVLARVPRAVQWTATGVNFMLEVRLTCDTCWEAEDASHTACGHVTEELGPALRCVRAGDGKTWYETRIPR